MQVASDDPTTITKVTIASARRRRKKGHPLILHDRARRGLARVVNATVMRREYAYRPRRIDPPTGRRWPNRIITIDNQKTHSPDDARMEATRVKGQAVGGADAMAQIRFALADLEAENLQATDLTVQQVRE